MLFLSAKEYTQINKIKYSFHLINSIIELAEIGRVLKINEKKITHKYERNAKIIFLGTAILLLISKIIDNKKITISEYPKDILIPTKLLKLKLVPTIKVNGTV
jgi:hypothetical protein